MMARVTDGDRELVDTHAHITLAAFDADREAVLVRAREAGVRYVVCPAVDVACSIAAVAIAERRPGLGVAVGVHPSDLPSGGLSSRDVAELEDLSRSPCVVAIGETGLDLARGRDGEAQQREAFRAHVRLAQRRNLPVVVHNRDAADAIVDVLEEERAEAVILHCFTGEQLLAEKAARHGWYLGIGGIVTFRSGREVASLLPSLPADRIVVETDSPYLAPAPYRGRRNEPANVVRPLEVLAQARGMTIGEAAAVTTVNAYRAFPLLSTLQPLGSG